MIVLNNKETIIWHIQGGITKVYQYIYVTTIRGQLCDSSRQYKWSIICDSNSRLVICDSQIVIGFYFFFEREIVSRRYHVFITLAYTKYM